MYFPGMWTEDGIRRNGNLHAGYGSLLQAIFKKDKDRSQQIWIYPIDMALLATHYMGPSLKD